MTPQRILIVEDNYLIALDIETGFQAIGFDEVSIATSLQQAWTFLDDQALGLVLLDVNLSDGVSYDLARELVNRKIPLGFISGYDDTSSFPQDLAHLPLLSKPFDETDLSDFVGQVWSVERNVRNTG